MGVRLRAVKPRKTPPPAGRLLGAGKMGFDYAWQRRAKQLHRFGCKTHMSRSGCGKLADEVIKFGKLLWFLRLFSPALYQNHRGVSQNALRALHGAAHQAAKRKSPGLRPLSRERAACGKEGSVCRKRVFVKLQNPGETAKKPALGGEPAACFYPFFSGMVKMKRVETASLSAFSSPWCALAMAEAMDKPRPKPVCSPREASAR